ncbi:MAG: hypothetical protein Kow0092_02360 [Deferrisomatales bacterium]
MADVALLEQMRQDVIRALEKPPEKRRWALIVDIRKCVGCHACTVACKAENKTPPDVDYRIVRDAEDGSYPNVQHYFMPVLCMQCENPPCVKACRDGAIFKRPDGVVQVDYARCHGCEKPSACPYGVLHKDDGRYYTEGAPKLEAYETAATFEYGERQVRRNGAAPVGRCRKCHYCVHRLEAGMLPACVTTCIGQANYFGDLTDPESVVAKVAKAQHIYLYGTSYQTGPTTRYVSWGPGEDTCGACHE